MGKVHMHMKHMQLYMLYPRGKCHHSAEFLSSVLKNVIYSISGWLTLCHRLHRNTRKSVPMISLSYLLFCKMRPLIKDNAVLDAVPTNGANVQWYLWQNYHRWVCLIPVLNVPFNLLINKIEKNIIPNWQFRMHNHLIFHYYLIKLFLELSGIPYVFFSRVYLSTAEVMIMLLQNSEICSRLIPNSPE